MQLKKNAIQMHSLLYLSSVWFDAGVLDNLVMQLSTAVYSVAEIILSYLNIFPDCDVTDWQRVIVPQCTYSIKLNHYEIITKTDQHLVGVNLRPCFHQIKNTSLKKIIFH